MNELIERLTWKLNGGWKNYRLELSSLNWPGILLTEDELRETASEITRLQEALAAAEAERDAERRLRTEMAERFFMPLGEPDLTETRKKALEEAAAAYEAHDKVGREWVHGSLWDQINREGAARVRALAEEVRK